jgi:hypothetical protein
VLWFGAVFGAVFGCLVLDWLGDFGINPLILRYFWDFPKKMIFL